MAGLYFFLSSLRQTRSWDRTRKVPRCCISEQYLTWILPLVTSSARRVNLVWHKLVRAVQKNFSKAGLLNKLLVMFYLKCWCCQQRTQQTSTLSIKVTARIFLLALPWLLALVQLYCMSQAAEQHHTHARFACARGIIRPSSFSPLSRTSRFGSHGWNTQRTPSLLPSAGFRRCQPGFALAMPGCA